MIPQYIKKQCDHSGRIVWELECADLGFVICYNCPKCETPVLCNTCSGHYWEKREAVICANGKKVAPCGH